MSNGRDKLARRESQIIRLAGALEKIKNCSHPKKCVLCHEVATLALNDLLAENAAENRNRMPAERSEATR